MRVRDLGAIEVSLDGVQLRLGAPRQRALLAVLVMAAPHPVAVFELMDRLWADAAPATAAKSIQKYVGQLRGILGRDRIVFGPGGYQFVDAGVEIDSHMLDARIADAYATGDPAARAALLRAGLDLVRGEVLSGLNTPYAMAERSRILEVCLVATEHLLVADLALDRASEVATSAQRLVAQHPYREGMWMILMRALYRTGRQRDALAAYQRLRTVLAEELGIEPAPRVRELEQMILEQHESLL